MLDGVRGVPGESLGYADYRADLARALGALRGVLLPCVGGPVPSSEFSFDIRLLAGG